MSDYISRETALLSLTPIVKRASERNRNILSAVKQCIEAINWCPAADVAPARHGKWIWNPNGMDFGLGAWCCSECKSKAETWWANDPIYNPLHCSGGHFCGNCGALMDKDGDGDV